MIFRFPCVYLVALLGCTTVQNSGGDRSISLADVLELKIGDSQSKVFNNLGIPHRVFRDRVSGDVLFVYFQKKTGFQRLSVNLDSEKKVESILWLRLLNEPEADLKAAKACFQGGTFVERDAEWVNPHVSPSEKYYEDPLRGYQITVNTSSLQVESLSWSKPFKEQQLEKEEWVPYIKESTGLVSVIPSNLPHFEEIAVSEVVNR